jgi:ribosome-binding protein aMBF1 (putative translation factor)
MPRGIDGAFVFRARQGAAMTRRRDHLIDKKIGSVIRMQRVKLGMSQMELGEALGVTFQQIQKYEHGRNAVASTRIADLCPPARSSTHTLGH